MKIRIKKPILWGMGVMCGLLLIMQQSQIMVLDNSQLTEPIYSDPGYIRFYTTHAPISINSYSDFDTIKSSGNGSSVDPFIIEGWNITASGNNGISISGTSSHFIIRDCWITADGGWTHGINLYDAGNGTATIMNCIITGNSGDGIRSSSTPFAQFKDNFISGNGNNGIDLDESANATLINNTINMNYYGIYTFNSDSPRFINNTCNSNREAGIQIYYSDYLIIENNTCSYNSGSGFSIQGSVSVTIHNNTLYNNRWSGINLGSADNSVISNNTCYSEISDIWTYDIDIYSSPNSQITNNIASISLYGSADTNISNNTCTERGIRSSNCPYSSVTDNTLVNSGFYINEWSKDAFLTLTVTGNTVNGLPLGYIENMTGGTISMNYGQLIMINCNSTLVSNLQYSNTAVGISLFYCTDCDVINNTCNYNKDSGIDIRYSNFTTVANNTCIDNHYSGLYISDSHNSIIYNNTCIGGYGGIEVCDSFSMDISYNTCTGNNGTGIEIEYCPGSIISNNNLMDSGFSFWEDTKEDHLSRTMIGNTVNGLPLGYFENQIGLDITSPYGQLVLVNCNSSSVVGQNYSNATVGIALFYCKNSYIALNNCSYNGEEGIIVEFSPYSTIFGNLCHDNQYGGINLDNSPYSEVSYNYCAGNGEDDEGVGIGLDYSSHSVIFQNYCYKNGGGIGGYEISNTTIANNTCTDNSYQGIALWESYSNLIANNTCKGNGKSISDEPASGIEIHSSDDNIIYNNHLIRNHGYGIQMGWDANNNTVYSNHFVFNGEGGNVSQAFCEEIDNHWNLSTQGNYWTNYNGTGAYPMESYSMDPESFDYYPSLIIHDLYSPKFIYPTGGETLSGSVIIHCTEAYDTFGHDVTYTIGYSIDGGSTLVNITTNFIGPICLWDTTTVADGSEYELFVVAECSDGLIVSVELGSKITINNLAHTISVPTVISPNGGETLSGTVSIQWTPVTDSIAHSVTYTIAYSTDGVTWTEIVTGHASTSYDWDTTTVSNSNYWIKVTAVCSEGLSSEDVSDAFFTVTNGVETTTVITTTTTIEDTTATNETTTTTTKISSTPGFEIYIIPIFLSLAVIYRRKNN
jgi:F-box protein 11